MIRTWGYITNIQYNIIYQTLPLIPLASWKTIQYCTLYRWVSTIGVFNARGVGLVWKIPSGKLSHNYGKIHHFQWVNPLFLWPCSTAMLNYQRVVVFPDVLCQKDICAVCHQKLIQLQAQTGCASFIQFRLPSKSQNCCRAIPSGNQT